jgi:hypothetical protein
MKATVLALGVALGAFVAASTARAQQPCYCPTPPVNWDPYWGAVYAPNCYGQWYGPNVYLHPPFAPFQGMVFPPQRPGAPGMPGNGGPGGPGGFGGPVAFPSHQWARSPRDFFMWDQDR